VTYELLRFAHLAGMGLLAGGLIGVFVGDVRARQVRDVVRFAEAVRAMAVFYDGVVMPGALLLAASGAGLIVAFHDGWAFLEVPWLAGMVGLFLFEAIEGNTITRLYILRLRRLANEATAESRITPALIAARERGLPTFTHFLDIPLLLVIVALGAVRPDDWVTLGVAVVVAFAVAWLLCALIPRLYPWTPETS
jgi:uncharacterized membrane protein